jgi:pimeloyl-ACP methyl ester carboxylesterase
MYSLFEREKLQIGSAICYQWPKISPKACIVFIHGLGGNSVSTWGNLPTLLMGTLFAQNKDVFSYAYSSFPLNPFDKDISTISDEFTTFIESISPKYQSFYFVSHSLGSLVCLKAMLNLLGRDNIWAFKLKGHVMLAPAMWGSKWAYFGLSPITRALKPNSEFLTTLIRDWKFLSKLSNCKSFVLAGTRDEIVLKNSDELFKMDIKAHALSESHISIPKTSSIESQTYRAILDCLYEIAGSKLHDSRAYIQSLVIDSGPEHWEFDDGLRTFLYKPDHKLKIKQFDARENPRDFNENWTMKFPDNRATLIHYEINYDNHHIRDFPMVLCDGGRYLIPLPKSTGDLTITSEQYRLAKIMEKEGSYIDLDQGLSMAGIQVSYN